ncbi:MAG TPA: Xaa-Pro peptidase family protein [Methanospirillum sp.]|nr:Xaa-Pro peptidase family protein [Methanospirillum sp.]
MNILDDLITGSGAASYCLYASSDCADMRYLTGFVAHDPVPVIKIPGEKPVMILPQMEADRGEKESFARVVTRRQAGYYEIIESEKDPYRITAAMMQRVAPGPVIIPPDLPVGLARALEDHTRVIVDNTSHVRSIRAVKATGEIEHITRVQRAAEKALEQVLRVIHTARVRNGVLWHDDEPLTSERIRFGIQTNLLMHGCSARDTIVACGEDTAMPHCQGSGPLYANQPIVIDLFPQCERTGYHADMTRTVSKGEPSSRVLELHAAVNEALILGESQVKEGASGSDIHQAVRDLFEQQGFRSDSEGFTHSLGHGVGLEVHELPSLSPAGGPLVAGNVVTVEPGLYYRGVGGVRIENLGVVTGSGYECLTRYDKEMIL